MRAAPPSSPTRPQRGEHLEGDRDVGIRVGRRGVRAAVGADRVAVRGARGGSAIWLARGFARPLALPNAHPLPLTRSPRRCRRGDRPLAIRPTGGGSAEGGGGGRPHLGQAPSRVRAGSEQGQGRLRVESVRAKRSDCRASCGTSGDIRVSLCQRVCGPCLSSLSVSSRAFGTITAEAAEGGRRAEDEPAAACATEEGGSGASGGTAGGSGTTGASGVRFAAARGISGVPGAEAEMEWVRVRGSWQGRASRTEPESSLAAAAAGSAGSCRVTCCDSAAASDSAAAADGATTVRSRTQPAAPHGPARRRATSAAPRRSTPSTSASGHVFVVRPDAGSRVSSQPSTTTSARS